ncbi:MAG: hypothetical protein ABR976_09130 [Terracidiphilus sp.]
MPIEKAAIRIRRLPDNHANKAAFRRIKGKMEKKKEQIMLNKTTETAKRIKKDSAMSKSLSKISCNLPNAWLADSPPY